MLLSNLCIQYTHTCLSAKVGIQSTNIQNCIVISTNYNILCTLINYYETRFSFTNYTVSI